MASFAQNGFTPAEEVAWTRAGFTADQALEIREWSRVLATRKLAERMADRIVEHWHGLAGDSSFV